jgi:hypothetical protein
MRESVCAKGSTVNEIHQDTACGSGTCQRFIALLVMLLLGAILDTYMTSQASDNKNPITPLAWP